MEKIANDLHDLDFNLVTLGSLGYINLDYTYSDFLYNRGDLIIVASTSDRRRHVISTSIRRWIFQIKGQKIDCGMTTRAINVKIEFHTISQKRRNGF